MEHDSGPGEYLAKSGDISGADMGDRKTLLNIPQCTGSTTPPPRSTTKNYLVPNVSVVKVENSFSQDVAS